MSKKEKWIVYDPQTNTFWNREERQELYDSYGSIREHFIAVFDEAPGMFYSEYSDFIWWWDTVLFPVLREDDRAKFLKCILMKFDVETEECVPESGVPISTLIDEIEEERYEGC